MEQKKIHLIEMDKVKSLLSISQEDLESSEVLLNHKKYSNSVWNLLQSIEKTTKAVVLMAELVKFKELKKKIGHNPLFMYNSNISDNLRKAESLEEAIKKVPDLKNIPAIRELDLEDFKQKAKSAKEVIEEITKNKKIFSDNPEELDGLIKEMNRGITEIKRFDMQKVTEKAYKEYKEAWTKSIKAYIELSEKQGKHIDDTEKEQALSISDETFRLIADNTRKNMVLQGVTQTLNTLLNMIISPHFKFLRYPDEKNPLEYYTEKNPLINRLNDLISIQKDNLAFHKEYFEILEREYSRIVIEK